MTQLPPPKALIDDAVARALAEDLGLAGDITSAACIPASAHSRAVIAARRGGVVCGVDFAVAAFAQLDPRIDVAIRAPDGAAVASGALVLEIEGPTRGILGGERVALNFLCHLSGIATATAALVAAAAGTGARIACTRKTTPGLRAFEKHAVACGGGSSHRFGLFDAVMVKDNHIAACGGDVAAAVRQARAAIGHLIKVEVEIDRLDQLDPAIAAGADVILLDNMSVADLAAAVKQTGGRAILEASGNVTVDSVAAIARTGVDVISSGWITHSAPILDLGLDFVHG
ncbi:MAG: carboxylating nicotinate-nucleotide diphosphorylase [Alphaproteobacteria bacterium]|nr:carboxylating nicotinate-nucleotide diphosphorylase [Alphaproteobacteria bacterium]